MPTDRKRDSDSEVNLPQALTAAATLGLKVPGPDAKATVTVTQLGVDIAYKRTANRLGRYLAHHGIVGRRGWRLYRRYWRAYELLQKWVLLVKGGWRDWGEKGVGGAARDGDERVMLPSMLTEEATQVDREWEEMWGGREYWKGVDDGLKEF